MALFYYDIIHPDTLDGGQLDQLLALGWFRTHQSLFTSSHVELNELYRVHWLRYPLSAIRDHRSHERTRRRNKKFSVAIEKFSTIPPSHVLLYSRYRAAIDFDGALTISESLFGDREGATSIFDTYCISVMDGDQLVAGGYFDAGDTAGASILHFFDHRYARYSPGKFLILLTIDYLRAHGFRYYYPGYVVEGLSKMDYKLFLGRQQAEYFSAEKVRWLPFHEQLLIREKSPGEQPAADLETP